MYCCIFNVLHFLSGSHYFLNKVLPNLHSLKLHSVCGPFIALCLGIINTDEYYRCDKKCQPV